MRISAKAEYACLALIELARSGADGAPMRVRTIADAQNIPERYLVQILLQLKAAGLVHSIRGAIGGYRLALNPDAITVADVIAAIDGPGEPPRPPESNASRELLAVLERARTAQRDVLASTTVSDLAGRSAPHDYVL